MSSRARRLVALEVDSELERETIPRRVTLAENAVPYAGELVERHSAELRRSTLAGGEGKAAIFRHVLALRRPWPFAGGGVSFGALAANTSLRWTVTLYIVGRAGRLPIARTSYTPPASPPEPMSGMSVLTTPYGGGLVEMDVEVDNLGGAPVLLRNLQVSIWGSNGTLIGET